MKINPTQAKIIEFVSKNPNCDLTAIEKGTKIKSVTVAAEIKKLVEVKILARHEKGKQLKYTSLTVTPQTEVEEALAASPVSKDAKALPVTDEKPKEIAPKTSTRDTTKYKVSFGGKELGDNLPKGASVLTVVKFHIHNNPKITLQNLKKVFSDELLLRFGIFQLAKDAQKISGDRPRYFLKPEQLIKLKDGNTIAVCNQFTSENIKPFFAAAKKAGYSIR